MRSRLLCLLGLLLATATPPMAQTVTAPVDRTKGIITVTAEPTGACDWPAGQFRMLQATGTLYACVGDVVTRQDIPDCGAEAPTGACSAQAACQEAGALYLCNAGTWAAVAASGDMLKATYDVGADGTVDSASGVACTDCVALGTETSGNYAGSSSEGGSATALAGSLRAVGALRIAGAGVELDANQDRIPELTVGTTATSIRGGLALEDTVGRTAPTLRAGTLDLDHDGLANESAWYVDHDGDGHYTPGEPLLFSPTQLEYTVTDCSMGGNTPSDYPWWFGDTPGMARSLPGSTAVAEADRTVTALGASTARGSACYCWAGGAGVSGQGCGIAARLSGGPTTSGGGALLSAAKMLYFAAGICTYDDDDSYRLFVGGGRTDTDNDLTTLSDAIGFWAAPEEDVDGDGTAAAADRTIWVLTSTNALADSDADGTTDRASAQLADGDGDGLLDVDVDGTADIAVEDAGFAALDTGLAVGANGTRSCFDLEIVYDGGQYAFWVNGVQVARQAADVPLSRMLAFWGVYMETSTSSAWARVAIDYVAYLGRR